MKGTLIMAKSWNAVMYLITDIFNAHITAILGTDPRKSVDVLSHLEKHL